MRPPTPQILDFGGGFWILGILDFGDLGFWIFGILGILDFGLWGFWILAFGILGILDFGEFGDFGFWGFWIFGFLGILDFGFLEHYVADLYVQSLDFGIWGFWILGIWDFGFWGSWILDFGLGILDGHLVTKFWMLHKKRRLCTPNRVGGLHLNTLAEVFYILIGCWFVHVKIMV